MPRDPNEADVELLDVSKRYWLRGAPPDAGQPSLWQRVRSGRRDFWALRDVTFEVRRNETLGIIGHNGAGKSTLLKLLSAITAPTRGEIRIRGRLAALIELGSGFHPELTGRENLFLSGSLLGMRRREIAAKLDRIVDFAGIGQFLDVPVKWYSSGMYVRLGFAIAAHLDPDILLVDEVLTVGDAEFQVRCYARIRELQASGLTIIFISHDLAAVERLCSRVVLLDHGSAIKVGDPPAVIGTYQRIVEGGSAHEPPVRADARLAEIADVRIFDETGTDVQAAWTGRPIEVAVECRCPGGATAAVDVFFYGFHDGVLHCRCTSAQQKPWLDLPGGTSVVRLSVPALGLKPGIYTLGVTLTPRGGDRPCAWRYARTTLHVQARQPVDGRFFMPCTASVEQRSRTAPEDRPAEPAPAGGRS
jgi:lipopolysaccharide transport system ATP-binding protein